MYEERSVYTVDPLAAYTFRVFLGTREFGFSKVSGLSREAETTVYQEGGVNDRVHILRGPVKNPGVLRLERGAYAGENFPFYLAGERLKVSIRIEVRSPGGTNAPGKSYTAEGLVVKRWEAGELDAMQNTILIDRFELNYEYLSVTTL